MARHTTPIVSSTGNSNSQFSATRWSVVVAASGDRAGSVAQRALDELIRAYWFPLYAFVRRQGHSPQVAEDSVQEFFTRMMEKNYLAGVDRAKGKFRSFLLAAMKNFLANEWDKQQAQKRGSGKAVISLDGLDAEARYALEPADGLTPERLFDRRWALAVLDQVLVRLRQEYSAAGKQKLYESLKDCLTGGSGTLSHAEIGRALGLTEGAAKVAAHRIRKRYRELLRDEIAQTVASPDEVESEITYLLNCL